MKKVWIGAAVVVLLGVVLALSLRGAGRHRGKGVYVEPAARREIVQVVKASGQIDPRVKVNISAHVVAKIEQLYVHEGEEVRQGQPFLQLEKETFVAARDRARADLEIARSRLRQAEITLDDSRLKLARAEKLAGEKIISREDFDAAKLHQRSAELDLEQAREAVAQAQAGLAKAGDDLAKTTIYAPIGGRVITLNAKEGEVVVSGTMNNSASIIGTIADLSEILAEVDVDETEVALVATGQQADLHVDAVPDRPYHGRVEEIGSSGFNRPQQPDVTYFKVKVLFADPDADLRPGMSVRAEIRTAAHPDAVVVPIQAVVERKPVAAGTEEAGASSAEEIKVVFVKEGDVVRQQAVATGIADATHIEIVHGLDAGAEVVTGPYRTLKDLHDGDEVHVQEAGEETSDETTTASSSSG